MSKLRHLRLSRGPVAYRSIACSPLEAIKPYGGKRVSDDSELVNCEKCLEIAAKLVEDELSPTELGHGPLFRRTDSKPPRPPSKFDTSLGARCRVR